MLIRSSVGQIQSVPNCAGFRRGPGEGRGDGTVIYMIICFHSTPAACSYCSITEETSYITSPGNSRAHSFKYMFVYSDDGETSTSSLSWNHLEFLNVVTILPPTALDEERLQYHRPGFITSHPRL